MKKKALVSLSISLLLLAGLALLVISLRNTRDAQRVALEPSPGDSGSAVAGTLEMEKVSLARDAQSKDEAKSAAEEAVEAVPEPPPLLRGLVTGEGSPVAGASVLLFGVKRVEETLFRLEDAVSGSSDPIPEIPRIIGLVREELAGLKSSAIASLSGDDGVYEFRGIEPGNYIALSFASGWLFRYGDVANLEAGATRTLDLALERGTSIGGRVVDGSGRGLPGITVLAEFRPAGTAGLGKILRRVLRLVNGEFLRGPFETVTAEDGSFTCSSLPPGIYDLAALTPSGLEGRLESVETGSQDALVYLGKGASVRGAFVDGSGLPARGAVFYVEREDEGVKLEGPMAMWSGVAGALERELGEKPRRYEAGERGEFQVKPLSAGKYRLSVPGRGWLPLSRSFALDWGENLDLGSLPLDAGDFLGGIVRDEDGKPIAGARIRLSPGNVTFFNMGAVASDIVSGEKTGVTGAQGEFRISGLAKGEYRLVANARSYVPEVVKKAPTGENVDLVLRRGARVEGRVLEAGEGEDRPIAGARVRCGAIVATTDPEGRFVLDGVTTENPDLNPFAGMGPEQARSDSKKVRVRASAAGYIRGDANPELAEVVEVEIRLARAPEIRGRVLDPDGQPLPGTLARLTFHVGQEGQFLEDSFDRTLIFAAAGITDLEGKFRFETYRQAGEWDRMQVVADHPLHARGMSGPIEVAEGREPPAEVEIRLDRAARIHGTVTDGTDPVRGAAVRLRKKPQRSGGGPDMSAMLSMFGMPKGGSIVYTREDGTFAHEKILPGDYILVAEASGYGDSPQAEVTIAAGEERALTLALERGGEILGVVVDAAAAPIPEVRIRALVEPAEGTEATRGSGAQLYQAQKVFGGAFRSARTDGDGRFALRGLPPGTYTLLASRSGFTVAEVEKVGPGGDEQRIVLQRAAALRGVVVDAANGEPIPRFRISLVAGGLPWDPRKGLGRDEKDHADPAGRFAREDLEPGQKVVIASSPGFAPARAEVLLETGATAEVELALAQAGRILGAVVDLETGASVAGAQVALTEEREEPEGEAPEKDGRRSSREKRKTGDGDGDGAADEDGEALGEHFLETYMGESVRSGPDGSFVIEGAPPEPQTLVASHPEYISEARKGILVGPGQEAQARIALRKGLVCAGTLKGAAGDEPAGRFVFIRGIADDNRHVRKSTVSGQGGTFRIGGLEKGSYRIIVTGRNGGDSGSMSKLDIVLQSDVRDLEVPLVEEAE